MAAAARLTCLQDMPDSKELRWRRVPRI
jgi:hypothetical protein